MSKHLYFSMSIAFMILCLPIIDSSDKSKPKFGNLGTKDLLGKGFAEEAKQKRVKALENKNRAFIGGGGIMQQGIRGNFGSGTLSEGKANTSGGGGKKENTDGDEEEREKKEVATLPDKNGIKMLLHDFMSSMPSDINHGSPKNKAPSTSKYGFTTDGSPTHNSYHSPFTSEKDGNTHGSPGSANKSQTDDGKIVHTSPKNVYDMSPPYAKRSTKQDFAKKFIKYY